MYPTCINCLSAHTGVWFAGPAAESMSHCHPDGLVGESKTNCADGWCMKPVPGVRWGCRMESGFVDVCGCPTKDEFTIVSCDLSIVVRDAPRRFSRSNLPRRTNRTPPYPTRLSARPRLRRRWRHRPRDRHNAQYCRCLRRRDRSVRNAGETAVVRLLSFYFLSSLSIGPCRSNRVQNLDFLSEWFLPHFKCSILLKLSRFGNDFPPCSL